MHEVPFVCFCFKLYIRTIKPCLYTCLCIVCNVLVHIPFLLSHKQSVKMWGVVRVFTSKSNLFGENFNFSFVTHLSTGGLRLPFSRVLATNHLGKIQLYYELFASLFIYSSLLHPFFPFKYHRNDCPWGCIFLIISIINNNPNTFSIFFLYSDY